MRSICAGPDRLACVASRPAELSDTARAFVGLVSAESRSWAGRCRAVSASAAPGTAVLANGLSFVLRRDCQ
ncbi:MAG: hypothetical protein LC799_26620, partial [Actinobacteria bacterium]|nr:hypothetical protein [Actinomycetota bacterium]